MRENHDYVTVLLFKNGRMVAYAANIAHLPDIGGALLHSEASDIFEEGIRFLIVKLHKAGVPNQNVLDIIAANNVMGCELVKFLDEYGLDDVDGLAEAIHSRSEAQTRKAIKAWPNGRYSAHMLLDGYDTDITLKATVIVGDDSIHVDYTGTSQQVLHSINCRTNYRYAHSVYALKCLHAEQRRLHHADHRRRAARIGSQPGTLNGRQFPQPDRPCYTVADL